MQLIWIQTIENTYCLLPVKRSMRGTRRSQIVSTKEMQEESFTFESHDDDVFCADKFAKKLDYHLFNFLMYWFYLHFGLIYIYIAKV